MNIMQFIVGGMIIIIMATITLALLSYAAFKMRERRTPNRADPETTEGSLFFDRVRFHPEPKG